MKCTAAILCPLFTNCLKKKMHLFLKIAKQKVQHLSAKTESVSYYGGETVGISAVFSAINEVDGVEVNKIFSADDVPGYQAYPPHDCPLCKGNQKVDAITNGYGYSLL